MNILLKWNLRMLQENPIHMLFTFIYLVFNYALLTGLKLFIHNRLAADNTDGGGILWYMATILAVTIFFTTFLTMYNTFQISIREREPRYRILSAAGTAKWQLHGSLFIETLILNCMGLILGVILGCSLYGMISDNMKISDIKPGVYDQLINGIKTFISSIQLRDVEQFNDLSDIQVSGLRYYLFSCIDLLKAIRLWVIDMYKLLPTIVRRRHYINTTDYINILLPRLYIKNSMRFEGFQFVETPQFGFYCLLLEFLAVPAAMAMSTRKLLPNGSSKVKKLRKPIIADQLPLHRLMRRLFGVGGEVNRLMDKRGLSRRRFFLSAFVISITTLAIVTNLANDDFVENSASNIVYLRSSGDNKEFERRLDEYITGEEALGESNEIFVLRTYTPRVYCLLEDDQINASTLQKTDSKNIDYRPSIYSVSENGGELVLPEMIFLDDGKFDDLREQAMIKEQVDALLLPGTNSKGEEFRWLGSDQKAQNWTLRFYTQSEKHFEIDETGKKSKKLQKDDGYETDKLLPDYKINADELMSAVRELPTEEVEVRLRELSSEMITENRILNVDRDAPVLVFPESAARKFAPHLRDTDNGLHLWMYLPGSDNDKDNNNFTVMLYSLRRALMKYSDGCVAEHPWGTGTRYVRGEYCRGEISWTIKGFHRYFYNPPHPIYADIYLRDDFGIYQIRSGLKFFCLSSLVLMSLLILINIINTVYGHHILRRHEYAVLQSCGMSERQTRRAILYEAVWYSLRSVIYGFGGYLLIYTPLLAALSYGESYERIQDLNYDAVSKWQPDLFLNIKNAFITALKALNNNTTGVIRLWWIFPISGAAVFILFLLINAAVKRHMRADTLVPLLKKDI